MLSDEENASAQLPKMAVLKIDKDCFPNRSWELNWVMMLVATCRSYGVRVLRIRKCLSARKGVHYYIDIHPPLEAELANELHYVIGDDSMRCDRNRARIESELVGWSKLFEVAGRRLRTIYCVKLPREHCGNKGS